MCPVNLFYIPLPLVIIRCRQAPLCHIHPARRRISETRSEPSHPRPHLLTLMHHVHHHVSPKVHELGHIALHEHTQVLQVTRRGAKPVTSQRFSDVRVASGTACFVSEYT